ncbi:hypothetical protein [Leptolyngbya sp. 'hensonii']|uniref:hypothetical protein n=1 Tax=Leptolyngbya sp. 'hensonii' TaxID=1922337 RepID=UPI000A92FDFE|nr:hypothetical protein [Leptolyngbya sp. 'hensonii']
MTQALHLTSALSKPTPALRATPPQRGLPPLQALLEALPAATPPGKHRHDYDTA